MLQKFAALARATWGNFRAMPLLQLWPVSGSRERRHILGVRCASPTRRRSSPCFSTTQGAHPGFSPPARLSPPGLKSSLKSAQKFVRRKSQENASEIRGSCPRHLGKFPGCAPAPALACLWLSWMKPRGFLAFNMQAQGHAAAVSPWLTAASPGLGHARYEAARRS